MSSPASDEDWFRNGPVAPYTVACHLPPAPMKLLAFTAPAGDYSRPASPALVVIQFRAAGGLNHCDFGAGAFKYKRARAGQFCIVPPASAVALVTSTQNSTRAFGLTVSALQSTFEELRPNKDLFDLGALHSGLSESQFITGLLDRIWSEAAMEDPIGHLFLDSALIALGIALLREAEQGQLSSIRGGLAPWQIKRVLEAMEEHLPGDIRLQGLADIAGLSPAHFGRAFKHSTGLSPHRWLQRRRIERAQELMARTPCTLAEVALAVGFSAQAPFTTAFRRIAGTTPGAWRRRRLN